MKLFDEEQSLLIKMSKLTVDFQLSTLFSKFIVGTFLMCHKMFLFSLEKKEGDMFVSGEWTWDLSFFLFKLITKMLVL